MWAAIFAPLVAEASETEGRPAVEALADILEGNQRFIAGKMTHLGATPTDRAGLAAGQSPHTMVLTCADSRVAPEIVFDQGLGELFVVRSAGNSVDEHLVASLEYAVEHLGSKLLVVLGHTSCGTVKAALGTPWGTSAGSPALDDLVHDLQLCIGPVTPAQAADPTVRDAVWANVRGVRLALINESEILANAVASGKLVLRIAVYDLSNGQVVFDRAPSSSSAVAVAPVGPAAGHGSGHGSGGKDRHATPAPAPAPASDHGAHGDGH